MRERTKSSKDLKVWAKGMDLAEPVYGSARSMPKEEQYRMTSQMLRSAASVPANIAEGYQCGPVAAVGDRGYRR